jgi:hypothetical protein
MSTDGQLHVLIVENLQSSVYTMGMSKMVKWGFWTSSPAWGELELRENPERLADHLTTWDTLSFDLENIIDALKCSTFRALGGTNATAISRADTTTSF